MNQRRLSRECQIVQRSSRAGGSQEGVYWTVNGVLDASNFGSGAGPDWPGS